MKDPLRRIVLLLASGVLIAAVQSSTTVKAATTYTMAYTNPADPLAAAGPAYFYEENFDGTSLDSSRWTASTNGGLTVSVDNGSLHMGQGGSSSLDFPYVSSVGTVFPTAGNFQVEIAAQYSQHGGQGDGIAVLGPDHQPLFILWGSPLVVALEGTPQVAVAGPFDLHNYRLTFVDGVASVYVDNMLVLTTPLSVRPESLWLGTPTIGQVSMWPLWSGWVGIVDGHVDPTTAVVLSRWWWGTNWSPFSVDYIRVGPPTPPAWRLPWSDGELWYYFCGPHSTTNSCPNGPTTEALDFGTTPSAPQCPHGVDMASVVRSVGSGRVYEIPGQLYAGQYKIELGQWTGPSGSRAFMSSGNMAVYEHVSPDPARAVGDEIHSGDPLGHPSCLGNTTAVSIHLGFYKCSANCSSWSNWAPNSFPQSGITLSGWSVLSDGTLKRGSCEARPTQGWPGGAIVCPKTLNPPVTKQSVPLALGQTKIVTFTLLLGQAIAAILDSWGNSTVDAWLTAPDGTTVDPSTSDPDVSHIKGESFEYYELINPLPGQWTLNLYGTDLSTEGENIDVLVSAEPAAAVGGIADLPDVVGSARATAESSHDMSIEYAAIAGAAAAGLAVLGAGGWYARRRWLGRR